MIDKNVFRNFSYGVYLTTSYDENNKPVGCVTNSVMQITSEPSTVAVSINHENYTNQCIKKNKKFAVAILPETIQPSIIGTFGYQSSRNVDKFEGIRYHYTNGLPIIEDACGVFICEVIDTMETNTHTVFLGRVTIAEGYKKEVPMTYRYYHEKLKGSSPKTAPSYIEEEKEEIKSAKTKYKCRICGYVHEVDGELPDDYICPICGQPKSAFDKIEETKEATFS